MTSGVWNAGVTPFLSSGSINPVAAAPGRRPIVC